MTKKILSTVAMCLCCVFYLNAQYNTLQKASEIMAMSLNENRFGNHVPNITTETSTTFTPDEVGKDVEFEKNTELELKNGRFSQSKSENKISLRDQSLKFISKEDFSGSYIFTFESYFDQGSTLYKNTEITANEDGTFEITGFAGLSYPVQASYDEASGLITIPAQMLYTHSRYGDVYICPFNASTSTYDPTGNVYGYANNDGTLELDVWGFFVLDGDYAGGCFDVGLNTVLYVPNASIETEVNGEYITYNSYAKQISANELLISNFAGNGAAVIVDLYPDKTISITPQYIYTNSIYGDFYCYPADWAKSSGAQSGDIEGSGTQRYLELGNWGVFSRYNSYLCAYKAYSSLIQVNFDIVYPDKLEPDFDGAGTSQSPYLIKTVDDLQFISQSVREGETYTGVYFLMCNDLDLGIYDGKLRKIGLSDTKYFDGLFDGNGYTIQEFTVTGGDDYNGLFGYTGANAVIRNLSLSQVKINSTGSQIGAIAGRSLGTIENCHVTGNIKVENNASGGIAGYSQGSINNCSFSGIMSGFGEVGGIVGFNIGKVNNCHVNGILKITTVLVSGRRSLGGIVGTHAYVDPVFSEINNCYVSGQLSDTSGSGAVGGIAGVISGGKIDNCFNVAEIYSESAEDGASGGIAATAHHAFVNNCYNAGSILGTGKQPNVGGIVGRVSKSTIYSGNDVTIIGSEFNSCYSVGIVKNASVYYENNLYGDVYDTAIFQNCYYDHQVTGSKKQPGALSTAELISADGLPGFDSDIWSFSEGYYPSLKGLNESQAASLSVSPMVLSSGDFIGNVKKSFIVMPGNNFSWKLYEGGAFVDETAGLKIEGNNVIVKNEYSSQLLCAYNADLACIRSYYISVVPMMFEGEGTSESPFLIKTKEDLFILNDAISVYKQEHVGDYFKMTNDIDMDEVEDFTGIASKTSAYGFGGTFDGNGYSIHNLKISALGYDDAGTPVAANSYMCTGFFGLITEYAEVKNLTIADDCAFDTWTYGGAVVGASFGKITNCRNYAPVTGYYSYVGGICGALFTGGSITDSYNSGEITGGAQNTGGISGVSQGVVANCQNDGIVTGKYLSAAYKEGNQNNVGGIVGLNYGDIYSCSNNGSVTAYSIVAGIAGCNSAYYNLGSVIGNINTGLVTCKNDVLTRGAIVGQMLSSNIVKDNLFDRQITIYGGSNNASLEGIIPMKTADLINGEAIEGFDSNLWSFEANNYPVLLNFKDEEMSVAARQTYICFGENEYRTNVKTAADLSVNDALSWSLTQNVDFRIEDNQLLVTKPTEIIVISDTLIAVNGNFIKSIPLASIPDILNGSGSEDDPFLVETTTDMTTLADFIASSGVDYSGNHFKLVNDLDYTDTDYKVIAAGTLKFQGTFNGNDKKIMNITYSSTATSDKYIGLFGTIGESGTLKNLTFESSTFEGHSYVGGMVGKLYGKVENCINRAEIRSAKGSYVGGIVCVGYEGSSIHNCENYGLVYASTSNVGGIASDMKENTLVENCFNKGEISPSSSVGGGITYRSLGTIQNCYNESAYDWKTGFGGITSIGRYIYDCYNTADITTTGSAAGIAISTNGTDCVVENCYNTGNISGSGSVAGVIATVAAGSNITNCYNLGDIYSAKANAGGAFATINGAAANLTYITDCYNAGKVTGTGNNIGGFTYRVNANAFAYNCANYGDVEVTGTYIGGFAASVAGEAENCFNAGNVTATGYAVGGFSGLAAGSVNKCFNLGDVTAGGDGNNGTFGNAGGMWGYGKPNLNNCFNVGKVTGPDNLGGLLGMSYSGMTVTNCYTSCEIVTTSTSNKIGSITTPNSDSIDPIFENNFYNNEINGIEFSYDIPKFGQGISHEELTNLDLGSEYSNLLATYPMLTDFEDHELTNFYMAALVLSAGDTMNSVSDNFTIGTPVGVEWTASNNLQISDNVVMPVATGSATLTKTVDGRQKIYNLYVTKTPTGINDEFQNKECIETIYFNVNGVKIAEPEKPGLYIQENLYEDGSKEVKKIIIK